MEELKKQFLTAIISAVIGVVVTGASLYFTVYKTLLEIKASEYAHYKLDSAYKNNFQLAFVSQGVVNDNLRTNVQVAFNGLNHHSLQLDDLNNKNGIIRKDNDLVNYIETYQQHP